MGRILVEEKCGVDGIKNIMRVAVS